MAQQDAPRRFVFQGLNAETATVSVERCVAITDIAALHDVIGADEDEDPDLQHAYCLEAGELAAVGALCLPPIIPDSVFTRITRWSPLNDVPYLVHTGFELPLMLDGRKPLAVFSDGYPSAWFDDYLAPFEPFVQSGRIARRIVATPMAERLARRPDHQGLRDVYFALPGDEWRIDAYIEMRAEARLSSRNGVNAFERRQGTLIGLEDWQNDWWLDHRRDIGLGRPCA